MNPHIAGSHHHAWAACAHRTRNHNGRFRAKRSDTRLGTLEETYGEISDRRRDAHLGTIREAVDLSLTQLRKLGPEITHKPGLDGRVRNQNGRIRAKNGETRLATLEATYGPLCSLPGATPLWLLRAATGNHSLSFILRHPAVLDASW